MELVVLVLIVGAWIFAALLFKADSRKCKAERILHDACEHLRADNTADPIDRSCALVILARCGLKVWQ
jgi:hypothetical protein